MSPYCCKPFEMLENNITSTSISDFVIFAYFVWCQMYRNIKHSNKFDIYFPKSSP